MSITPYNNFTVRDLSGIQQPYVNSSREVGYFRGTNLDTIPQNSWRSLPAVLNTNNGIASVDASGLTILNPGVYSIKLSLFPTSTQDVSSNISFNFGTRYLFDVSTNVVADSFGGVCPTGMFTYDPTNNFITPGIISWVADGYSSGNTGSNFIKTQTDELSYNYSTAGTGGQIFSGICTTEITFILNIPRTIYFNVSTNSTTVTMGNCIFTLQLISSYSPNILWTPQTLLLPDDSLPTANWTSIASSSDGTTLAATLGNITGNTRGIYRSINSGSSWVKTSANNLVGWTSIASSSNGQYLVASTNTVTTNGGIWRSLDSGTTWDQTNANVGSGWVCVASSSTGAKLAAITPSIFAGVLDAGIYVLSNYTLNWIHALVSYTNWVSIASSSTGAQLVAVSSSTDASGGGIYTSTDPSNNIWVKRTTGIPATNPTWSSIASSSTGQYLAAVASGTYANGGGIYTSDTSGNSWTRRTNGLPVTNPSWTSITSSSSGQHLAAVASGGIIYGSTDFGFIWTLQNRSVPGGANLTSIASSSDGEKLAFVASNTVIYTGLYTLFF